MSLFAICISSLEKSLFRSRSSVHFFDFFFFFASLILRYMSCLYTLEINPLLVVSFTNTFSHLWVVFLFMVSLAVQKLLSLIRSHLFVFVFISHYCGRWIKKDIAVVYVRVSHLCLLLRVL